MASLWRAPLRSRKDGVDHHAQIDHCLAAGVFGIGWPVHPSPSTPEEALEAARTQWSHDPGAERALRRLLSAADGDIVWTQGLDRHYLVGEVAGPWRYDNSPAAERVDAHQLRDVRWAPEPLLDAEVPGAVIRAFSRQGSAFERIHNEPALDFSRALLDEAFERPVTPFAPPPDVVLRDLLEPFDVEDLVFVFLQAKQGWLVLPASRRAGTAAYEYELVHRTTGEPPSSRSRPATVPCRWTPSAALRGRRVRPSRTPPARTTTGRRGT